MDKLENGCGCNKSCCDECESYVNFCMAIDAKQSNVAIPQKDTEISMPLKFWFGKDTGLAGPVTVTFDSIVKFHMKHGKTQEESISIVNNILKSEEYCQDKTFCII